MVGFLSSSGADLAMLDTWPFTFSCLRTGCPPTTERNCRTKVACWEPFLLLPFPGSSILGHSPDGRRTNDSFRPALALLPSLFAVVPLWNYQGQNLK